MSWLIVLIAAPLASWGEEPGNARRGTADRPSRSALLGLAGAALGILREDADRQRQLRESFRTATRTLRSGTLLTDFHTFQSLPAAKGPVATRAAALARKNDVETSITRREYRADALWQAAFGPGGAVTLEALCEAFQTPRFALWAGRKSCPLAHPLAPVIVRDDDIETAFIRHGHALERDTIPHMWRDALSSRTRSTLALDVDESPPRNVPGWVRRRHDEPGDRQRWHFSSRTERVYEMGPTDEPAGEAR
jgi:CRISPR system Cascade subunit CasD